MLSHFKRYTIPRIYYLFKGKGFFFKILLLYRLLLLGIILVLFKRKNFWFRGKFGQKKFEVVDKEKAYDNLTDLFQKEILLLGALD